MCVAGVGDGQRLGTGSGGGMGMGLGVHVEEGGETGVDTHLSARYGVNCESPGERGTSLAKKKKKIQKDLLPSITQ